MLSIKELAEKYNVKLEDAFDVCSQNNAASCGCKIYFGEFDDPELKLAAFFHELGHIEFNRKFPDDKFYMSTISKEGMAWELGFLLANKEGFNWYYNSKQFKYGRDKLLTYINYNNIKELAN